MVADLVLTGPRAFSVVSWCGLSLHAGLSFNAESELVCEIVYGRVEVEDDCM